MYLIIVPSGAYSNYVPYIETTRLVHRAAMPQTVFLPYPKRINEKTCP